MRKLLQAGKAIAITLIVLCCAVFSLLVMRAPVFEPGESYELYYGASSSSLMARTETPALDKLLSGNVAGESVCYEGNRCDELIQRFQAELLFTEEAAGVTNYYLYSPVLRGGVELKGHVVNLHIAVSERQTAAGTPLIFGGF